jgi:hypothetical protein
MSRTKQGQFGHRNTLIEYIFPLNLRLFISVHPNQAASHQLVIGLLYFENHLKYHSDQSGVQ